jgi:hypothetical protein
MQTLNSSSEGGRTASRAVVIAVGVVVVMTVYGQWIEARHERARRQRALLNEISQAMPGYAAFVSRLAEIRRRPVRNMVEYREQCLQVEGLLNRAEPMVEQKVILMRRAADELADDPKARAAVGDVETVTELDTDIFQCLRREITASAEIMQQPPSQQLAYYNAHVPPIRAEIARLAARQQALIKDLHAEAARQGVHLTH